MTITVDIRQQVRQRAGCACEFCGVTEESVGSELTIDHYQPKTKGGSPATLHFIEAEDGLLYPLTATGRLTVERLRLNRPPLVTHRRQRTQRTNELLLLQRYNELVLLLENMNEEMTLLLDEQRTLLKEQRDLLRLLLRRR